MSTVEAVAMQMALRSLDDQIQTLRDLRASAAALIAGGVAGSGILLGQPGTPVHDGPTAVLFLVWLFLSVFFGVLVIAPASMWRSRGEASALLEFGQSLPREDYPRFVAGVVAAVDGYFRGNEALLLRKSRWLRWQMLAMLAEVVTWGLTTFAR
ncbi:MAG: hypothetical protein ABL977_15305 [Candidatus Eisenbacteria bacterium]